MTKSKEKARNLPKEQPKMEPEIETKHELEVQPMHGAMVEIEKTRAVQEIQSALVIAKKFPRDETECFARIMKSCERHGLAEKAVYHLPISGQTKSGPSIRLAEELARSWGNVRFGFKVIDRSNGRSKCIAFCTDLERNSASEMEFEVEHWIEVGKAPKPKVKKFLTDPVEIDRLEANRAARKLRNCILNIIPGDVVEAAVKACKATLARGGGVPLVDRVRNMVICFAQFGVDQAMLEKKLGHKIDLTTGEEVAELTGIYQSLVDKQAKRGDFFEFEDDEEPPTSGLSAALKGEKK